jgi:PAS domain S-box-containing protein
VDLEGVRQTWETLTAGDFPLRHENHWAAKNGSQRFIAWSNTALILPDGQIEYIIATGVDITEQKQAEKDVLVSEVRYRRLFEAARDGILILNADSGQIVDVNPFIEEMLGYSHKEFLNKKLWEIGLFKNIAASKEAFLELQNKGYIRYENMPLETQDGHHIAVEFVSNLYQVDHQKVIQCNIRDITTRIQAEEAFRKSHDELEIRVKERTNELAQTVDTLQTEIANRIAAEKKILVYQKRLRSLATEIVLIEEKERRAIAAALHDSLGPLLAFSKRELGIIRKSAPQELTESLAYVHDKIKQAVDQTRNLTFDLSPATLYALGLEHALEELVEHFAQEGRFNGNCHICEPIGPLAEDIKILLYRSVRELMVNIVKHAGAKNVNVTLAMDGNDIQVAVEDDGVGFDISDDDLKTGKLKGFGLFNIYERLIQAGGRIDLQSPNGGGIKIVLQLPLTNKKE